MKNIGLIITIVLAIIGFASGYGMLQAKVENAKEEIESTKAEIKTLKETPTKVAVIQQDVNNLENKVDEFKTEQRLSNRDLQDKMDKVLNIMIENNKKDEVRNRGR